MRERLSDGDVAELIGRTASERAAGGGENEPAHLVGAPRA